MEPVVAHAEMGGWEMRGMWRFIVYPALGVVAGQMLDLFAPLWLLIGMAGATALLILVLLVLMIINEIRRARLIRREEKGR